MFTMSEKIVLIDYGSGNVQSVKFALERLGYASELTEDPSTIGSADKVIFPGVGEAANAMEILKLKGLDKLICELKQPVLGICLGMQLMCGNNEEGNAQGLGIFDIDVKRFPNRVKVPQIGWNQIENLKTDLFRGLEENEFMYLVHSYYVPDNPYAIATTDYGLRYASAIRKGNFFGVQFHPEKSGKAGERILDNFLKMK